MGNQKSGVLTNDLLAPAFFGFIEGFTIAIFNLENGAQITINSASSQCPVTMRQLQKLDLAASKGNCQSEAPQVFIGGLKRFNTGIISGAQHIFNTHQSQHFNGRDIYGIAQSKSYLLRATVFPIIVDRFVRRLALSTGKLCRHIHNDKRRCVSCFEGSRVGKRLKRRTRLPE